MLKEMIRNIIKPTLIIDKSKCLRNIKRMAEKARNSGVKFRPHFKTHQSAEVGSWFRSFGVDSITVSSVSMAEYFFRNGWRDITIAFPVNILEIDHINDLAAHSELNLLVISRETLKFLIENIKTQTGIYIKIDTGYHRTGILAEDVMELDILIEDIRNSNKLEFKGFLTHAGHTYHAKSINDILSIHEESKRQLLTLKERYSSAFENIIISVGDTPSCSIATDFTDLDEIRPGNFVYYDLMQHNIGSCSLNNIADSMACPVVGKDSSRNEIFIYGGAVHFSKEYLLFEDGLKYYGLIVHLNDDSWSEPLKNTFLARISQEHGIVKTSPEYFDNFNIGDLIGVLPVHSCLTANLMREDYFTF